MATLEILQNTWFGLIGLLLVGYSILDGFDLGIGSLLPFLAKTGEEKNILFKSIGPFWDGNEVWLLAGGGALFASFPHAYATVFSGFYLALMLVLFALILRAVSIEFFVHETNAAQRNFWQYCFITGSFIPSLLYGVALGNVIIGVPLDQTMNFTGNFFTLLRPFPLVVGLLGLNAILLQGAAYAAMKTNGDIRTRARKLLGKLWISFILLFVLSFVMVVIYLPAALQRIPAYAAAAVVITAWWLLKRFTGMGKDTGAFFMSSLAFVGLWGITAAIHFPNLVRATNDPALSLTVRNASATAPTLGIMVVIALIALPLVFVYTYIIFKTFKGTVK